MTILLAAGFSRQVAMYHRRLDRSRAAPLPMPDMVSHRRAGTLRGRRNHFSGIAAEESVTANYRRRGAIVMGQRIRTPEGELDLVLRLNDMLIFVEVKKRRNVRSFDSPVSHKQWQRLEKAALHYITEAANETGVQPFCRFDVAMMGPDGSVEIIENARSFDAQ